MFLKYWRKAAAFLVCLSLITATGCESRRPKVAEEADGTSSTVVQDADSQTPEDNIKLLDDLDGKYRGKTYKIVTTNASLFKAPKNSADGGVEQNPLERAISDRMNLLSKSFGIKFDVSVVDSEATVKRGLRNAVEKGQPYADLLCVSATLMAELMEEGLLENIQGLPYVDLDASYMHSQSLSQQTVGNKLYFYSGDATLSLNSATVLFYNSEILENAGIDPVAMAKDGSFTWAELEKMASSAAKQGCYGIDSAINDEELAYSIYASTGNKFISIKDGALKTSYSTEAAKAVNSINASLFKKYAPARVESSSALSDFKKGKTAFLVARLDSVAAISSPDVEWGILPLPKLSEGQSNYVAPVNHVANCVAVPKGCDDSAFAGFMLNAFLAASTNGLDEGLKTTYVNYYFWDNDSAIMLNLIEECQSYDYGIFMSTLPEVYDVSTKLLTSEDNLSLKEEDKQFFYQFSNRVFG